MPMNFAASAPIGGFVPTPPRLAYMNADVRAARATSAKSRPSSSGRAAAATAAALAESKQLSPTPQRPGTATQKSKRTFLQDNEAAETVLPQPLPPGIPYVATFTTYDDLIDRKILSQPSNRQVRLSTNDVRLMYDAKCADQCLKPTWGREMRFLELISTCCRGQQFVLRETGLGPRSAAAIARVLEHSDVFTVLDLSGNRLKDEGAISLAQLLTTNDILVRLGLRSNDIGSDGITALCDALQRNVTLTSLDLGGIRGINRNHMGGRGADALGTLLTQTSVLHTLDISSNGLGVEGCGLIAAGLSTNKTLRRLDLSNNNIGADGCRLLSSVLKDSQLDTLDIRRNDIGDVGAAFIAAAYAAGIGSETIMELHLEDNNIREAGCRSLAPMLRTTPSLKLLSLSHNNMGPGHAVFFECLRDNRKLRQLLLVDTGLPEASGPMLAKALEAPASVLELLDISRNRLSDPTGAQILSALASNHRLQSFHAAGCSFANGAGTALIRSLKSNSSLTSINLKQNLLSGSIGDQLLEELKGLTHIRSLVLTYNDIPYQAMSGINAILQRNNDAWRKDEGRRLEGEIEQLSYAQKDLFQTEEDIVSERRAITEKQDDKARRAETIRGQEENFRRLLRELDDKFQLERAEYNAKQDNLRARELALHQERQQRQANADRLSRKIDDQKNQCEKMLKQADRLRHQLKALGENQAAELKPIQVVFDNADTERRSELEDAKWQAEAVVELEMRILAIRRSLGHAPDAKAKGKETDKPSGSKTPRKGAQTKK
jgi:Ran GTPase-activating protein (RanGAP) involved in mRNA processing and transport